MAWVTANRVRTKRLSLVEDEILEQYEGPRGSQTQLPEELKKKIQSIRTRFKTEPERAALKLLINYFLLEGFSQPRKLVLETVRQQFGFSLEKASVLYDYAIVSLRSVLHEYYTPVYSGAEMLRLCRGSTLLAEIHGITGEKTFAKLLDIFAGLTVSFPSKSALEKMRKSQEFLNGLSDEKQAFCAGPLGTNSEQQLLDALAAGHHTEAPLYGSGPQQ